MKLLKWVCVDGEDLNHFLYTENEQPEPVTCTFCGGLVQLDKSIDVTVNE